MQMFHDYMFGTIRVFKVSHYGRQHEKDYELSEDEVLCDLISYHPSLAGVKDNDSSPDDAKGLVGKHRIDDNLTEC